MPTIPWWVFLALLVVTLGGAICGFIAFNAQSLDDRYYIAWRVPRILVCIGVLFVCGLVMVLLCKGYTKY